MNKASLEPGILSTFKGFTGLRLVLITLAAIAQISIQGWPVSTPLTLLLALADALLLFGYLSWEGLARTLKSAYLPVGIIIASAGPILEQLTMILTSGPTEASLLITAWQLFPILFIPLFITGWQYSFRTVLLFCLGTALMSLVPVILLIQPEQSFTFRAMFGVVFIRTSAFILVGYLVVKLMTTQRRLRRELAETNTRLAEYAGTLEHLATSRERNRLARELHDVVAHSLSGAAVELEAVKVLWDSEPVRAQAMLDQSLKTIRSGLTETRRALQSLRASPLEDMGLALSVRHLAESISNRAGLRLDLDIAEKLGDYSADVEQCIYRVAEEALANAAAHAHANCVSVRLAQDGGQLCLVVSDNGQGFDPQQIDWSRNFGLKGMQERAEMVGGQFTVQSEPGGGTTISLTIERNYGAGSHL